MALEKTLAFYYTPTITAVKSLTVQAPGLTGQKLDQCGGEWHWRKLQLFSIPQQLLP